MRVSVEEAARRMGASPMYVRMGLRTGRLPIGTAVQMPGGRWSYHIPRARLERYLSGLDVGGEDDAVPSASIRTGDDGGRPGSNGGGQAPSPARPAS